MNKNEQDMIRKIRKSQNRFRCRKRLNRDRLKQSLQEREKSVDSGENQWAGSSMPGADRRSDGIPELVLKWKTRLEMIR